MHSLFNLSTKKLVHSSSSYVTPRVISVLQRQCDTPPASLHRSRSRCMSSSAQTIFPGKQQCVGWLVAIQVDGDTASSSTTTTTSSSLSSSASPLPFSPPSPLSLTVTPGWVDTCSIELKRQDGAAIESSSSVANLPQIGMEELVDDQCISISANYNSITSRVNTHHPHRIVVTTPQMVDTHIRVGCGGDVLISAKLEGDCDVETVGGGNIDAQSTLRGGTITLQQKLSAAAGEKDEEGETDKKNTLPHRHHHQLPTERKSGIFIRKVIEAGTAVLNAERGSIYAKRILSDNVTLTSATDPIHVEALYAKKAIISSGYGRKGKISSVSSSGSNSNESEVAPAVRLGGLHGFAEINAVAATTTSSTGEGTASAEEKEGGDVVVSGITGSVSIKHAHNVKLQYNSVRDHSIVHADGNIDVTLVPPINVDVITDVDMDDSRVVVETSDTFVKHGGTVGKIQVELFDEEEGQGRRTIIAPGNESKTRKYKVFSLQVSGTENTAALASPSDRKSNHSSIESESKISSSSFLADDDVQGVSGGSGKIRDLAEGGSSITGFYFSGKGDSLSASAIGKTQVQVGGHEGSSSNSSGRGSSGNASSSRSSTPSSLRFLFNQQQTSVASSTPPPIIRIRVNSWYEIMQQQMKDRAVKKNYTPSTEIKK